MVCGLIIACLLSRDRKMIRWVLLEMQMGVEVASDGGRIAGRVYLVVEDDLVMRGRARGDNG